MQSWTSGKVSELRMIIEDVSGDASIFEYTDGGRSKIYHDKQFNVMTNSPTFDKQCENLKQYQGFGGNKSLPGTTELQIGLFVELLSEKLAKEYNYCS